MDESEISKWNDVELMKSFCKIVEFYGDAKGLSELFLAFLWCTEKEKTHSIELELELELKLNLGKKY